MPGFFEAADSRISLIDILSNTNVFFELVNAITPPEWDMLQILVTIKELVKQGQQRVDEEAAKQEKKGGGWSPYPKSALKGQLDEARDENTSSEHSLWRKLYTIAKSIDSEKSTHPVIIFGLICNHEKDKKSKPTREEQVRLWPTVAQEVLVKVFLNIKIPFQIWLRAVPKRKRYEIGL